MVVTALYAGLGGLVLLGLAFRVIRLRWKHQVGIGSGGHEDLARAIRVQGNFVEYAPLTLLLLALAESLGLPAWLLHGCGGALVAGRLLHAQGLSASARRTPGRFIGMNLTFLALSVLALANLGGAIALLARG